jgi:hypothetical protein
MAEPKTLQRVPTQPNTVVRQSAAGQTEAMVLAETHAIAMAARAKADVEAMISAALAHPRDWDQVQQNLLADCMSWEFADEALYELEFKKWNPKTREEEATDPVTNYSVRFAEAAQVHMGNIDVDVQTTSEDGYFRRKRVVVTDLENLVRFSESISVEKTVERKYLKKGQVALSERANTYGDTVYTVMASDSDLRMKENGLVSRSFRNCLLRLLKPNIKAACRAQIAETLTAAVKADPGAKRKEIIAAFATINVPVTQLKIYLGVKDLNMLQPDQIVHLQRIFKTVRNGERSWADIFEERTGQEAEEVQSPPEDAVTAPIEEAQTTPVTAAPAAAPAPATPGEIIDPGTGEVLTAASVEPDKEANPVGHFLWRAVKATTPADVSALMKEAGDTDFGEHRDAVGKALSQKKKEVKGGSK